MTKSLLTERDIKIFILQTIEKAKPRKECFYTRHEICRKLGLNERTFIYKYSKKIKPVFCKKTRKYYNINHVIKWLNNNDIPFTLNPEV